MHFAGLVVLARDINIRSVLVWIVLVFVGLYTLDQVICYYSREIDDLRVQS